MSALTAAQLLHAYSILFDTQFSDSIRVINNLDIPTLKEAYRKKVLETHPDRSNVLGLNKDEMANRFHAVIIAYETLSPFISSGKKIQRHAPSAKKRPPQPTRKKNYTRNIHDRFYNGNLPDKELRIGQFMYYSGIISWKNLIDAIVWQRRQRPMFGQISCEWGFLTPAEVREILAEKSIDERFGEYATQNGYLNYFQQLAVAGRQKMLQKPIGKYFTHKGLITRDHMEEIVSRLYRHNLHSRYSRTYTNTTKR